MRAVWAVNAALARVRATCITAAKKVLGNTRRGRKATQPETHAAVQGSEHTGRELLCKAGKR
jgi:hypothetical protein